MRIKQELKVGYSDPTSFCERYVAKKIKGTLGITGELLSRVHIDVVASHLDVDLSYPGNEKVSKGSTVRRLKRYMSWV